MGYSAGRFCIVVEFANAVHAGQQVDKAQPPVAAWDLIELKVISMHGTSLPLP